MKYMLLMYADPAETKTMSESDREIVAIKHKALVAELNESGELLDGAGLDYAWNTTTMQWRQGDLVITEGPLIENQNQLTAYYVLELKSRERAYKIAERILDFHVTAVEVRRIHT